MKMEDTFQYDVPRIYGMLQENGFRLTTDTRKITPGDLFFALKGDNFDGNDFAGRALELGAGAVVVDDAVRYADGERVIVVPDVLAALQGVARWHRREMGIPVLCLTGSNGKTTTKELLREVLSRKFDVCATQGNLNNHIGVPLTLLSIREHHDFAVVEMGASHPHEIRDLSAIACPDYGYITNFGRAHLEGFGGVEGVIRTKSELYDFLRENGGVAFVNADDAVQMERSEGITRYAFSAKGAAADVAVELVSSLPVVSGRFGPVDFSTHLGGEYNFTNACAAVAVGLYFGIPPQEIAAALGAYVPSNNRSQWVEKDGNVIMMDAYNANPTSMSLSIANFARADTKGLPKVAVLGDMFELGNYAAGEHQEVADLAVSLPFERVFLIGEHFAAVELHNQKAVLFHTFEQFAAHFGHPAEKAAYLVKGSRGMKMERVLDLL